MPRFELCRFSCFVVNLSLVFFEFDGWTIIFVLNGYAVLLWTKVFCSRRVDLHEKCYSNV